MEIGNNKLSTHDMATAAERKVIPVGRQITGSCRKTYGIEIYCAG
jgi:hypothetical protein